MDEIIDKEFKSFEEKAFNLIEILEIENNSKILNLSNQKLSKSERINELNILYGKKLLLLIIKNKLKQFKTK
jgi:hypothetical protein